MTLNILNMEIHDLFDQFTERIEGHVEHNQWEQRLTIPSHIGKGSVTRTRIRPGMEIMYTDITYEQDMKLHIQEACPLFELSYNLSGEIYCEWNGKESYTDKQMGNVLFLEDVQVYEEKKAGVPNQLLEIRFAPSELLNYAGDLSETQQMETWLRHHRGNIDRYPDTAAIRKCVSEMIHCTYHGTLRRLYMESKALEFIALFGESDGYGSISDSMTLRHDDITNLKRVHELVQIHFEQPLSIRELAKRVGINEFKLKKGFRELFGMTIFELVRIKRMEKALWYMEVEGLNIGKTAVSVGYSNVSNFTTTFRKHYGCNPSEYLKRIEQQSLERNRL
ncbi:AraC family transcriptional regulator [Paenibacillus sp. FSL R5-0887]|jgi:AraC-like DNA-binding protein|uniref:AraC family transcriptional regulator n=1 Tax=Paenibacillus odorifer TaxID=189426 RepID=A0ABX3GH19_9BACL|nr:helix-turn-helix domain-containing protein [Paenibacillus odorifer]OMC73320.1 AraC family transcriptional regulator [Paenibacillus odorifer]OMC74305.1 AraC family transcriptional regulator [Paenibacillus odorifer]OMD19670.1 AraC family transcriptional regulator [Paenibacillus odorifer]OMD60260.1 AraC family transcriptional regulator [Paenibacillus odorifer]OMD74230.1 AraC family transcriptional regulator [Paenibacillus odorifer]